MEAPGPNLLAAYLGGALLQIGISIVLWFLANWLGSQMLSESDHLVVWPNVTSSSLLTIGVVLLGLVSVAEGIPDLVHRVLMYWPNGWIAPSSHNEIIVALTKVGIGIVLIALPWAVAAVRNGREPAR